ncbi:sensor histidine kinase [Jannaschia seohaensis]|uniref:histidine kinase n=1 Tax=Jannaschia seohaensis TaxID=475081 RepID=A0A2Y9A7I2_9RHOB|nr:ATP-binding protein [Jannaschia seohaensis]PWJ21859.1 two-component system sensor histidine kinase HupT/HoxJ [Jannaschia seohaensis]SSA38137.1 two-component system, NtrC family, sensor histidine kinase HupT/HoxJ [Jannaschia seohaensis]
MSIRVEAESTPRAALSDAAWSDVLSAIETTYSELASHQDKLEAQNAALDEVRRLLSSILGSVGDAMAVLGRDGRVTRASASLADRIGGDPAGLPAADLFDPDGRATVAAALDRLRYDPRPVSFEARLAEGEPLDVALSPLLDGRRRLEGAVLIGRPLGEPRAAYAELETSHRQLKEAETLLVRNEKMAALGRLLAGVAHELNNPISFVYANTHALEKYVGRLETYFAHVEAGATRPELIALRAELKLDRAVPNLRHAIEGAQDGAERVRDIVADLRRLSADGTGERERFDLGQVAATAVRWIERGSGGTVPRVDAPAPVPVHGNPGHVQQIVMNLVQNAHDALEAIERPEITVTVARDGDLAVLEVRDNGPGIPDAIAAHVFDPFFTTKPVGRGTGLGLSISNKIAEEHGGRLAVACPPEGGTVFRLELPLAEDAR